MKKRIALGVLGVLLAITGIILLNQETARPAIAQAIAYGLFLVGGYMAIITVTSDEPVKRPCTLHGPSRPTAPR